MLLLTPLVTLLLAASVTASPRKINARRVNFDWGTEKVRGLNAGGWLVLEPWITPSIFQKLDQSLGIVDEFTLGEKLGNDDAYQILKSHWDTWMTLNDFQKIARSGFNTVRIPIGYWAYETVPGEPYVQGAAPYLDMAINWARETGLKVWIDLHGAPGSQNGFDNSGHKVAEPMWQTGNNVNITLSVLQMISDKYARPEFQDVVVAIQLLNEPLTPKLDFEKVKQFYREGYNQVRSVSDTPVILHDGFAPPSKWNGFLSVSDNDSQNVVIDHHEYQVFTNDLVALPASKHSELVCTNVASYSQGTDKWVVVGEWTGAMTDCAIALNGYLTGARYDGTFPGSKFVGSCQDKNQISNWDQTFRDDMRRYIEAQLSAFETHTQGWVFWNFKTEGAHEWDAFALLDAGIFPQPVGDLSPNSICG
ncbi:putative glucan -beta-glucosidase precursor protein [Erysiphe necator]|uniref:glucan 1,3-beta-glucosidase n=1 Tax=Uncinula necator TaxID=52586 RepID=A0A0B1PAL7_UNCNE|nr:putative glucan -beta-glucosidase precursor protein [Erysiphe necator]